MSTFIHLRSAGVSVLVALSGADLPRILHWGGDLGDLTPLQAASMDRADEWMVVPNAPEQPLRVGVLPEARLGWMGTPGLIGSRDGRNWSPAWEVREILLDGTGVTAGLHDSGPATVEVRAEADDLDLHLTLELLPGGLVRTRADLTNRVDAPYALEALHLTLPVPSAARELLDFAGRWGQERVPQRRMLDVGTWRRDGRHGRTGADSAYVMTLGQPGFGYASGEVWGLHTAWSGNHVHYAERDAQGAQLLGGGEHLLPGEVILGRDETYLSPWVYGNHAVGLDAQAARFHAYLRSLPSHPAGPRPVTLNVWEAVYFDHDRDRLIDLADRAATLGVERFVLDDGWFTGRRDDHAGLGDWVVDPQVWPEGLHPLTDHVTSLGMEFGLWFEPEMVNADSDLARAHPDWVLQPSGRWPIESRYQQVLNLGIPDAFAHVFGQMDAILCEYPISYVKWDHNRDLIDAGSTVTGRPAVSEQTRAFYRLLDDLRAAHPGVEFESCSSGGARIDLEVLQRVERVWVSDNIDPQDRQRMLWWTAQLLPTELMGSHVASGRSHTTGRWHDLDMRAATAVFGHLGIEWDLALATPDELERLRWWIEWYKERRGVLTTGRLVRVDLPDPGVWFKGIVTDEHAIFSLSMELPTTAATVGRLRFPGLDPDRTYRVQILDRQTVPDIHRVPWSTRPESLVLTGRQLAEAGLRAPYLQPATVILFEFTASPDDTPTAGAVP